MRISDWSSDVCSSDLPATISQPAQRIGEGSGRRRRGIGGRPKPGDHFSVPASLRQPGKTVPAESVARGPGSINWRSEEHTSELQSLMRISYAVFCLKKKNIQEHNQHRNTLMKTKKIIRHEYM